MEPASRPVLPPAPANGGPSDPVAATVGVDAPTPPLASTGGVMIGRYRLLQTLGEGGWGVVHLAEQTEPVRRRVALKVIKLGMDTRAVVARFEAERQALAMMDHPGIARVLDAGATDTGRPYFVMELVRGLRITDYCEKHRLPIPERLRLFRLVCDAVQHAHQKGILHRDLKPSNILVGGEGADAAPKVIDFGIAKSMHGRLGDATLFTAVEQFIGTPAYMSPEQTESGGLDIDTRSDVYALGVILYELIAGQLPFDAETLHRAGPDEVRRLIREQEASRPSLRLRTLAPERRTTLSAARRVSPVELDRLLQGDLDWIALKALEKARDRRYESAAALSADLGRHLADEPVEARPPSTAYHARKFVSRHRLAVGAAAAVSFALVAGTGFSVWQALRARQAETRAVEAYRRSDELLDFMTGGLRQKLEEVGRLDVLEDVGSKALAFFASLDPATLGDAVVIQQAKTIRQIGQVRLLQGKPAEAVAAFHRALERLQVVLARHPDDPAALFERAQSESYLGEAYRAAGDLARALAWTTRYRETGLRLVVLNPRSPEARREALSALGNLAVIKRDGGDFAGARADMEAKRDALLQEARMSPDRRSFVPDIQNAEAWLGNLAELSGDLRGALVHFAAAGRAISSLMDNSPGDRRLQFQMATNLSFEAGVLVALGRLDQATTLVEQGLEIMRPLVELDPLNSRWRFLKLRLDYRRVEISFRRSGLAGAEALSRVQLDELSRALEAGESSVEHRRVLAYALRIRAGITAGEDSAGAERMLNRAADLFGPRTQAATLNQSDRGELCWIWIAAAELAAARGDSETAKDLARAVLEALTPLRTNTRNWKILDPAARAHLLLGEQRAHETVSAALASTGYQPFPSVKPPPTQR